ncbi:MAG: BON domain-containing protein [Sulfurimonadaceae bacterium]|jgi:osmotically-inducible protein OsmY|nr:BON domain-containing protein [Sulfurimonadaceae bacterium]
MKHSTFLKATIVATVLITSSSSLLAADVAKNNTTKTIHTIGERIDDTVITTQVKMALLLHRSTGAFRTEVTTTNGVVLINGIVQNLAEKDLVTLLVEDIHGVTSVTNNMTIAKLDTKKIEHSDDLAVTAKVRLALALHRSTSVIRTLVSTNNGVVTVSGIALNIAEKELVNKVLEDVDGVKSVINKMTLEK